MNVVIDYMNIMPEYIHFTDKKRNMIMAGGTFSKIVYSNEYVTLNGLYVYYPLFSSFPQTNKYTLQVDLSNTTNIKCIEMMCQLEEHIIHTYKILNEINKNSSFTLKTNLLNGTVKIHREESNIIAITNPHQRIRADYILKISGVWETATTVGITYKIIQYDTVL